MKKRFVIAVVLVIMFFSQINITFALDNISDKEEFVNSLIIALYEDTTLVGERIDSNKEITVDEFCVMLVKAFYPEELIQNEKGHWSTSYLDILINKNIITGYEYYQCKQVGINSASIIDRILIATEYYDRPLDISSYAECIYKTAVDCGLVSEDHDCLTKMTIKETAELIYRALNDGLKKVEYVDAFPVKYKIYDFKDKQDTFKRNKSYISQIPEKYVELFNKRGYEYFMVEKCEDYISEEGNVIGIFDFKNKRIYIEVAGEEFAVFHEFGHFVSYELFNDKRKIFEKILKEEGKGISKLTSNYAMENGKECFAEAFAYLLRKKDDMEFIEEFRKANPLTTAIILDNMINYDGLANIKEINKIINGCS